MSPGYTTVFTALYTVLLYCTLLPFEFGCTYSTVGYTYKYGTILYNEDLLTLLEVITDNNSIHTQDSSYSTPVKMYSTMQRTPETGERPIE